ncbi:DUF4189 domain-containing protein [Nocardia sp. NBC_01499]|uniref:DUF4189 domain-containing protein n=1 Tax=Nocardia sp. NBC_01499 TaxID=2903597 RepID=UPI0038655D26
MFNPLSQPDPAYQQGQPYSPQQYPSVPQYQQAPRYQQPLYQQAPQQYPPQGGAFPPGPPGQGYPPQYGPNGSGSGGGGKVLAVIGSILLTVVVIAGIIGLKVWKNNAKHHRDDANGTDTTSLTASTSSAPTTWPSAKVPPAPTTPPSTAPTTAAAVWIAAAYNDKTNEVHWATSSLGQEAAITQAQIACGVLCQEPIWSKDACVAFAFGRNNGWGSAWGITLAEAQDKAQARAQGDWNVPGPFEFWSKCARE